MRPYIFPLKAVVLAGVLLIWGCRGSDSSARGVAHKYLEARLAGNFPEAAQYVARESQDLFEELEDQAFEYAYLSQEKVKHQIKSAEESGKSAVITYNIEGYGEEQLSLIKDDGIWKVLLLPQSVPDAGLLMLELQALEKEGSADIDKETLDQILIHDGEEVAEWSDIHDLP
ncbi:MAG: hypothetical protein R3C61_14825 [Bacteroidia bacterium]